VDLTQEPKERRKGPKWKPLSLKVSKEICPWEPPSKGGRGKKVQSQK